MKYLKKEKHGYEVFHIRVPSELAGNVRAYAALHGISLNSAFVELSGEYLEMLDSLKDMEEDIKKRELAE